MSKSIRPHIAREPFMSPEYWRGLTFGMTYLLVGVAQLFTFEKFADITAGYGFAGGSLVAAGIAVVLPLLHISSLPFLFSMKLNRHILVASRWATIIVAALWLCIALYTNITGNTFGEAGLFGATIPVINGPWFIAFTAIFFWAAILVVKELPLRR
ncbi:hypothetical protein EOL96_01340 [Candidatus Saccharibacteria bacterium]|nr:hypothetical protein [Candidatus Saccharibacteria bacterium]